MCKHEEYIIGNTYNITGDDGICDVCKRNLPTIKLKAVYNGHDEAYEKVWGVFIPVEPFYCPLCGEKWDCLREPCNYPPSYWFEEIEEECLVQK